MHSLIYSLVHIIFNSVLVFFILVVLIEFSLHIFKIQNPRIRIYIRFIPILKLPIDTLYYSISGTHFPLNINPFSCKDYFLHFFFPSFSNLSLPQIIADEFSPSLSMVISIIFIMITMFFIGYRCYQFLITRQYIKDISQNSDVCKRTISNVELLAQLQKHNISIWNSSQITVPFASFDKRIYFPTKLHRIVSNEEFNAILAHEFEHIRHKDSIWKLIGYSIFSVFWWIPSQFWMEKIQLDQEMNCDSTVLDYSIKGDVLAAGIIKTISKEPELEHVCICQVSNFNYLKQRLTSLLNRKDYPTPNIHTSVIGTAICILGALIFWIC